MNSPRTIRRPPKQTITCSFCNDGAVMYDVIYEISGERYAMCEVCMEACLSNNEHYIAVELDAKPLRS